jgi:hypothetical protein
VVPVASGLARTTAAIGLVLVVAAGCAGVPTSGSVQAGNPVPAAAGNEPLNINLIARGPSPGQKPDEIVRGFLTSSASVEENHSVARSYLTNMAAHTWNPAARVLLYDDTAPSLTQQARTTGRTSVVPLRAALVATIGSDGGYDIAAAGERLSVDLRLVQQGGEWRINNPPAGVILTRLGLARSFEERTVYYLDRTLDTVVPDDVFLPASSTAAATVLVRRLLRGPSAWVAPAVRSAVPTGTTLIGTAPVDDRGTVTVDLSREVLSSTALQRVQLSAQIGWTLRQLPGFNQVRLLVDGTPLPSVPAVQGRDSWASYDPAALSADKTGYYRRGTQLLSVSGIPLPGQLAVNGTTLDRVSLAPSGTYAGGLLRSGGRTTVYVGNLNNAPRAVLSSRAGFTPPSWDASDEMWTVERSATPRVVVVRPPGTSVTVSAPSLSGLRVDAFRVSRDGTRVAVVAGTGSDRALLVARIRTGTDGALRLDAFRRPAPELSAVTDVSWADPSTLAVLATNRAGPARPWLVRVDGAETNPITTAGLTSYDEIAAAPGQPTLVESRGLVYTAQRGLWTALGRGSQPSYPG